MKKLLAFVLMLSILLNAYLAKYIYVNNRDASTLALQTNKNMLLMYSKLPIDTSDIVFIGSSITRWFPITELSKNGNIRNRGIAGDSITGVLSRIQLIAASQPKKLFIEIGINDLRRIYRPHLVSLKSPDDNIEINKLISAYTELIDTIKILSNNKTAIYIQSIFPENKMAGSSATKINEIIPIVNSRLKILAKETGSSYIDNYGAFLNKGALNTGYTDDGLHLNTYGWLLWYEHIKKYI